MSYNYRVNFAFEHKDSEILPEEQRHGFGFLDINTDHEPTTQEDFDEIAKTIGRNGDYKTVAVQTVAVKDEPTDDSDEVLEGEIIID